jgi:hypothetical protein
MGLSGFLFINTIKLQVVTPFLYRGEPLTMTHRILMMTERAATTKNHVKPHPSMADKGWDGINFG